MEIFRLSGVNRAYGQEIEQGKSTVAKIDERNDTEHQGEWSSLEERKMESMVGIPQ